MAANFQIAPPETAIPANTHAADQALAAAILSRDRKATARLVELHSDAVHRYVWKRLTPRLEQVDDLVQEVFLAAWKGLASYNGTASLRSWLISIARHKVEDHYRRVLSGHLQSLDDGQESDVPAECVDLTTQIDTQRHAKRAAEILDALPYEYAVALRWRYWEEQSVREMATASGRTEKTIERLLARARARFRVLWEERS